MACRSLPYYGFPSARYGCNGPLGANDPTKLLGCKLLAMPSIAYVQAVQAPHALQSAVQFLCCGS
jgi:hypothetical protein